MAKDPRNNSLGMEEVASTGPRGPNKPKNVTNGRVKTFGGASSVANGDLSPRKSWAIVNGK